MMCVNIWNVFSPYLIFAPYTGSHQSKASIEMLKILFQSMVMYPMANIYIKLRTKTSI